MLRRPGGPRERCGWPEINGVLWRKAPGFRGTVPFGATYEFASRFCFNERGLIASIVAP
jgi:hypothetical protein